MQNYTSIMKVEAKQYEVRVPWSHPCLLAPGWPTTFPKGTKCVPSQPFPSHLFLLMVCFCFLVCVCVFSYLMLCLSNELCG